MYCLLVCREIQIGVARKVAFSISVDASQRLHPSLLDCIYDYGYSMLFLKVKVPNDESETFNANYTANLRAFEETGLLLVTPASVVLKNGEQQFLETFNHFRDELDYVDQNMPSMLAIALQVLSEDDCWSTDPSVNAQFIQDFTDTALHYFRYANESKYSSYQPVATIIHTSWYDLQTLTNHSSLAEDQLLKFFPAGSKLWYRSIVGAGVGGESDASLKDYQPLACWTTNSTIAKTFGTREPFCGELVDRALFYDSGFYKLFSNTTRESIRTVRQAALSEFHNARMAEMNRQLNIVLFFQTILPAIEVIPTMAYLVSSVVCDSSTNTYAMAFATAPFFSPLVQPYRNFFCSNKRRLESINSSSN
ncbi:lysozyme-like protein 7 [Ditylenchus destructor]|uniref:Lysozyme-like protein 7 n=1 Tax=Ditylenchus destructor TaxID=166010 RepID=A0AAD4MMK8_9BILA|nr:lysozyme-like protein 7 [Ditylenchus destructor]